MGTHPIFESDFDCLTDLNCKEMGRLVYLVPISEQGRLRLEIVQEHLDRAGLQWKEISTDDVRFKIKEGEKNIFVMDPLEGDAYERLVQLNVQLLGCGAIISSLALK